MSCFRNALNIPVVDFLNLIFGNHCNDVKEKIFVFCTIDLTKDWDYEKIKWTM